MGERWGLCVDKRRADGLFTFGCANVETRRGKKNFLPGIPHREPRMSRVCKPFIGRLRRDAVSRRDMLVAVIGQTDGPNLRRARNAHRRKAP